MTEHDAVDMVDEPATADSLVEDFRSLGLGPGQTILAHTSLQSLGWVVGGAQTVVNALKRTVTKSGTIVMPTFTAQYSDPTAWSNPPVPDDWVPIIRSTMPPYRPAVTPTRGVGTIPEVFRSYPDVTRSSHPEYSFAAWGAGADEIIVEHALDYGLGEESPLAGVYDRDGFVLQLGTTHATNTSIHLAEYRADIDADVVENVAPVRQNGNRVLVEYENVDLSTDDFLDIGAAFERTHRVPTGAVGAADATLIDQQSLVDFAAEWMTANR